jgi:SAM-dependent methyltransferase
MLKSNKQKFWDTWHDISKERHTLTTNIKERIDGEFLNKTIATIFRHIDIDRLENMVIADYGCGTGRIAKYIAPHVKKYICIDISQKMLETTKKNCPGNNLEFMIADNFTLADDEVDFCFSYAALAYESSASEFWELLKEIDRFSKEFCCQLHSVPNSTINSSLTINNNPNLDFNEANFYRPSIEELKKKFDGKNYVVEQHEPDVRGKDVFIYKLCKKNLPLYLEWGAAGEYRLFGPRKK